MEQQADHEGISTNSWLVRAVLRGLDQQQQHPRRRRVGNRITGMRTELDPDKNAHHYKEGRDRTMEQTFETPGLLELEIRIPAGSGPDPRG